MTPQEREQIAAALREARSCMNWTKAAVAAYQQHSEPIIDAALAILAQQEPAEFGLDHDGYPLAVGAAVPPVAQQETPSSCHHHRITRECYECKQETPSSERTPCACRKALEQIQWDNSDYELCPMCDQPKWREHAPDCLVGAALASPSCDPCPNCASLQGMLAAEYTRSGEALEQVELLRAELAAKSDPLPVSVLEALKPFAEAYSQARAYHNTYSHRYITDRDIARAAALYQCLAGKEA